MFLAFALASCALCAACAAVIGLDAVDYGAGREESGTTDADTPDATTDAGASDACTGKLCGTRCCSKGASCTDSGSCSNDVVQVSGGGGGSCAVLADGSLWCWGENSLGTVGLGDAGGDDVCKFKSGAFTLNDPCRFKATRVPSLSGVTQVGSGFSFTCAVQGPEGSVWCWGRSSEGQLGHDGGDDPLCSNFVEPDRETGAPKPERCNATPQRIANVVGAVELAVGHVTACARTKAGEVFCWGAGGSGQLGNDGGASSGVAVQVLGLPKDVVQIATSVFAGGTCAVTGSGTAWCWGTITDQPGSPTAQPQNGGGAQPLVDLAEIRVGINHVCVRSKKGAVDCWGANYFSNLGRTSCDLTQHTPMTVVGLPSVVALDARWLHTCTLDKMGVVNCWGLSQDGALGRTIMGENLCQFPMQQPLTSSGNATVPVAGLPRITRIAVGLNSSFAIDEDGKLWAWGANDLARIGHEPTTQGDLTSCGDSENQTTCNPVPKRVEGLP